MQLSQIPFGESRRPTALWILLLVLLFGALVEYRSAFLKRRMTDLDVFLRAAWAVRTGNDFYAITDDNHWHYHYPPLFAILLVPLADPPSGFERDGMLPFAVSVALWYVLSLLCLYVAVRVLASALEERGATGATLRGPPVVICLVPIAATLMRGQVNLLLLALLCAMMAALIRGRSGQGGLWLAGAICLKVIPAYLLVYPLWRRDYRCLVGCAIGLMVGLGIIPALAFGPERTQEYYREWLDVLVRPGLGAGADQSRADELLKVTATDSQSFLAIIHNSLHVDRSTRPEFAATSVRAAHWLVGGVLTLFTLLATGWRRGGKVEESVCLGMLIVLMFLLSPVCHLHYFSLAVPLVMALVAAGESSTWLKCVLRVLLPAFGVACALPHLPGMELARDLGLATYLALALWLAGGVHLWKCRQLAEASCVIRLHKPEAPAKAFAGASGLYAADSHTVI